MRVGGGTGESTVKSHLNGFQGTNKSVGEGGERKSKGLEMGNKTKGGKKRKTRPSRPIKCDVWIVE